MNTRNERTDLVVFIADITGNGEWTYPNINKYLDDGFSDGMFTLNDNRFGKSADYTIQKSLAEIAADGKKKIDHDKIFLEANLTFSNRYLIGYSFGGVIAYLLAQLYEEQNHKIDLVIIDSPALDLSKKYLQKNNSQATKDIGSILHYVNSIYNLCSNPVISPEDLFMISQLEIIDQVDAFRELYLKNQSSPNHGLLERFNSCINLVKANLTSLIASPLPLNVPIERLLVITTPETRRKYDCDKYAGWEKYAKNITTYEFTDEEVKHITIMNDKNSQLLSTIIKEFLNPAYSPGLFAIADLDLSDESYNPSLSPSTTNNSPESDLDSTCYLSRCFPNSLSMSPLQLPSSVSPFFSKSVVQKKNNIVCTDEEIVCEEMSKIKI